MISQNKPGNWKNFTLQFSENVWFALFFFLLGWFLVLVLVKKVLPEPFLSNFGDLVGFTLRGLIGMGYRVVPKQSIALRIMFFVYLLTSNLVFLVYKANMTSALAVKNKEKILRNWDEVLVSDYSIMLPRGSFIREYLRTSEIPVEKEVFAKKVLVEEFSFEPNLMTLTSVMKEGVLYLFEKGYVTVDPGYPCSLEIMEEIQTITTPLAFAFPKDSKLKAHFDREILKFYENGERDNILSKVLSKKKTQTCSASVNQKTRLEDIFSAFGFLGVGLCISFVIFAVETMTKRNLVCKRTTTEKIDQEILFYKIKISELQEFKLQIEMNVK